MPIHDWARVDPGVFHAFRHGWLVEISRLLNRNALPSDHYALLQQYADDYASEAIWEYIAGSENPLPDDKQFTLAAYEADLAFRAYVQPVGIGDALPEMPLFLVPRGCVQVPLEETYTTAFKGMPARWRRVLEAHGGA
jgi:hypothetical protein